MIQNDMALVAWQTGALTRPDRNGRWSLLKSLLLISTVLMQAPAWGQAVEAGFSAYATLSSDYPHRGLSQTDESGALQLGLDYQHGSGFFVGAWISNVDFRTEILRDEPRETEVDFYVGYSWLRPNWSVAATLARYSYPGTSVSYDYTEVSARIDFRERFSYTLAYTDGILSHENSALNHELGIEWPLPWGMRLGGAVGRLDSDELRGGDYDHWNVGVSKPIRSFGVDVRFYDTDYAVVSPLGIPLDDTWVVSVSYQL